jgi:hypothetical protein
MVTLENGLTVQYRIFKTEIKQGENSYINTWYLSKYCDGEQTLSFENMINNVLFK